MADATTPRASDAASDETSADPDAVAYARDLIDQLHTLNDLAAAVDHQCTPRWWPHHIGEHWECECGHGYHVARADEMPGELSAKAIRLGILTPDTLGWCSDEC